MSCGGVELCDVEEAVNDLAKFVAERTLPEIPEAGTYDVVVLCGSAGR